MEEIAKRFKELVSELEMNILIPNQMFETIKKTLTKIELHLKNFSYSNLKTLKQVTNEYSIQDFTENFVLVNENIELVVEHFNGLKQEINALKKEVEKKNEEITNLSQNIKEKEEIKNQMDKFISKLKRDSEEYIGKLHRNLEDIKKGVIEIRSIIPSHEAVPIPNNCKSNIQIEEILEVFKSELSDYIQNTSNNLEQKESKINELNKKIDIITKEYENNIAAKMAEITDYKAKIDSIKSFLGN